MDGVIGGAVAMNDKDLSALIRMAVEAERLGEPGPVRFEWARADAQERKDRVRKMVAGVATLAAAACLGFAAITWLRPTPPAALTPAPVAVNHATKEAGTALATVMPPSVGAVLLAVFNDVEENCSCIQLNPADFAGGLANLDRAELVRIARETSCHDDPGQVLVIAMEGPQGSMPSSAAEAELLATAVRENTTHCPDDACFTRTAAPFLPEGVRVVAGSIALR